ncbi:uncharacterized protein LOC133311642 [Gastrolobium bilobum]|uniref:uncharacterized protein LOC133311642 n=1 Tax=Gastrolobium bilobum TaxID=150636 RepID=UPI002AAF9ACD|nr:uncharacterized protein LOC133311642 [Gastrolobium bilobum]
MEIGTDDQKSPTDDDDSRASRGCLLSEQEGLARGGKKAKGVGLEDAAMDDEMLEEGGAGADPVTPPMWIWAGVDDEEENWISKQKREDEEADLLEGISKKGPDDPLFPRYTFSLEEHKRDCEQWRKALIIKLLGKRMGVRFLMARLVRQWNLLGTYEVIDLDNGYLLLRFLEDSDYRHVLEDGPWLVNDHYVVVQRWMPLFDPYDESFKKLAVWLRIPGLPIELYTARHLWRIGNFFRRTLKVDRNSLRKSEIGDAVITDRARFTWICVEVDLRKSFLSKFMIGEKVYPVGYEGLHLICFNCGLYGHR